MLEVLITSKNERVFIRDLSHHNLQIGFGVAWALMDVDSKRPIVWNYSRHAPSSGFYLHCGIKEIGSPGIKCIVCHQVLRHPSEHGASSMGKHLPTEAHIANLNELTESELCEFTSSMVDDRAQAILQRQGSRGITIVCLKRECVLDIQVDPY